MDHQREIKEKHMEGRGKTKKTWMLARVGQLGSGGVSGAPFKPPTAGYLSTAYVYGENT